MILAFFAGICVGVFGLALALCLTSHYPHEDEGAAQDLGRWKNEGGFSHDD